MSQISNRLDPLNLPKFAESFVRPRELDLLEPGSPRKFYHAPEQESSDFYKTHSAVVWQEEAEEELFEEDVVWGDPANDDNSFQDNLVQLADSLNIIEEERSKGEWGDEDLTDLRGIQITSPRSQVADPSFGSEKRVVPLSLKVAAPVTLSSTWIREAVAFEAKELRSVPPSLPNQMTEAAVLFSQKERPEGLAAVHHNYLQVLPHVERASSRNLKRLQSQQANLKWARLAPLSATEAAEKKSQDLVKLDTVGISSQVPVASTLKVNSLKQSFYHEKIFYEEKNLAKKRELLQYAKQLVGEDSFVSIKKRPVYRPSGLSQTHYLSPRAAAMLASKVAVDS